MIWVINHQFSSKAIKMKQFLFITIFSLNINSSVQLEHIIGNYEIKYETTNGLIIYKLALNADGTFTFHSYSYIDQKIEPKDENLYAKGTWKCDKNLIFFSAGSNDFDDKHTLDFNNTKARFISKSPRDKSDREIKTSILFYESEFWMTGNRLVKQ